MDPTSLTEIRVGSPGSLIDVLPPAVDVGGEEWLGGCEEHAVTVLGAGSEVGLVRTVAAARNLGRGSRALVDVPAEQREGAHVVFTGTVRVPDQPRFTRLHPHLRAILGGGLVFASKGPLPPSGPNEIFVVLPPERSNTSR